MKRPIRTGISPWDGSVAEDHQRDLGDPAYRAAAGKYEIAEQIARLLILHRTECKMTQKQLGELLGTTESGVSRFESGQHTPNLQTLSRILRVLGKRIEFVDAREEPRTAAQRARRPATRPVAPPKRHDAGKLLA
jgi:transcriptional regulator with XRE-family HTH domain